jgi:hypothetical protein
MGTLPSARVTPSRPFSIAGVDFDGPFAVKSSQLRNAKFIKTYVAVFVCFATKAVHLEHVHDLTNEAFINTIRRFVSRRGYPSQLLSDNGTNFVGIEENAGPIQTNQYIHES